MMRIQMISPILPRAVPHGVEKEAVFGFLGALLFIGGAILAGWLLTGVMRSKGFKTGLTVNLILSGAMALVLLLRFGLSAVILQGIAFFYVLLFASCSDLTSHTMDDCLWVMVLCLGLSGIDTVGLLSMLIGAAVVFLPQLLMSLIPPHQTLGGADIKLSTAIAFLLGWERGLAALLLGLLAAVITMSVVQRQGRRRKKQPFALIPFLAAAALLMFLV